MGDTTDTASTEPITGAPPRGPELRVFLDACGAVRVVGELDLCSAPRLRRALEPFLSNDLPLILDLSGVAFMGIAGVNELLRLQELLGTRFTIAATSRAVARVLDATRPHAYLPSASFGRWENQLHDRAI